VLQDTYAVSSNGTVAHLGNLDLTLKRSPFYPLNCGGQGEDSRHWVGLGLTALVIHVSTRDLAGIVQTILRPRPMIFATPDSTVMVEEALFVKHLKVQSTM